VSRALIEISGFEELERKIKSLPDKVKRREITKILGQVANSTVSAAKNLAPVAKKPHIQKSKRQRFGTVITPGSGRKSIGKTVMRRARNPLVYVSPKKMAGVDGWYLRQFVIPGTKHIKSNPFLDRAYEQTQGKVSAEAETKVAKYIQKQIDRL
jgi:HK97 gp10 family phage protein